MGVDIGVYGDLGLRLPHRERPRVRTRGRRVPSEAIEGFPIQLQSAQCSQYAQCAQCDGSQFQSGHGHDGQEGEEKVDG